MRSLFSRVHFCIEQEEFYSQSFHFVTSLSVRFTILLYNSGFETVWSGMKSLSATIQMKATEQYFPVVLFIILYKVVLTLVSMHKIPVTTLFWCTVWMESICKIIISKQSCDYHELSADKRVMTSCCNKFVSSKVRLTGNA